MITGVGRCLLICSKKLNPSIFGISISKINRSGRPTFLNISKASTGLLASPIRTILSKSAMIFLKPLRTLSESSITNTFVI